MKSMIFVGGLLMAAGAASAVTVDFNAGNDGAIRFAANDLARILKDVPGKVALKADPSMDAEVWRFATVGGLWALAPGGRNAFTIECANYVKGDSDWYRFDRVIEANRLRTAAAAYKEPLKLYFRINLLNQPGTVFLKDLKVVPVVEACK